MRKFRLLTIIILCFVAPQHLIRASEPAKENTSEAEVKYWITSTGKRHNSSCRFYGTTKEGRYTTNKDEGSACKKCGG